MVYTQTLGKYLPRNRKPENRFKSENEDRCFARRPASSKNIL